MSSAILYHGLGIRGYVQESTQYVGGALIFWIRQEPKSGCCSACGSPDVVGRGTEVRRFRCVSLGRKRISIILPVPRLECRRCGLVRQAAIPFARPRRSYTKAFEMYAWTCAG